MFGGWLSCKLPLMPLVQAAACTGGSLILAEAAQESLVLSWAPNIPKAELLFLPSLKCAQVLEQGLLLNPRSDRIAQRSLWSVRAISMRG